jgi:hypothetical protein
MRLESTSGDSRDVKVWLTDDDDDTSANRVKKH